MKILAYILIAIINFSLGVHIEFLLKKLGKEWGDKNFWAITFAWVIINIVGLIAVI